MNKNRRWVKFDPSYLLEQKGRNGPVKALRLKHVCIGDRPDWGHLVVRLPTHWSPRESQLWKRYMEVCFY